MSYDVVIRGGTVVDGTGAAPRPADVAVVGDRIVEVGRLDGSLAGARLVVADGAVVTPGFVDIHTHLDAQLAWDPLATSSCWHGVTSVVLGNCGVTFAPCRPEDREYLAGMMESVEDIPAASIMAGLPWDWESYGEYLDSIGRMAKGVNVGGMVGHCAVRHWAMGERSLDEEPASATDVARMCEAVEEAVAAGALGFSTSRTFLHRVPDGRPVPGTYASPDELLAIGDVLGRLGRGVFEAAARLGEHDGDALEQTRQEMDWMTEISLRTGRPVTFGLAQSYRRPQLYARVLELVDEATAKGATLRPQTTARGIALLFGLSNRSLWGLAPAWLALQDLDLPARLAVLADPGRRAVLVAEAEEHPSPLNLAQVYVLEAPDGAPRYVYGPEDSLAAHAASAGESPAETFIRMALDSQGRSLCNWPFLNQSNTAVEELLAHPSMAIGLGDSGAHVGLIMDASLPTYFLSYWVRDRRRFSLEDGVRRLTSDTAGLFGIRDRGVIRPGAFADINVFDLDALALPMPEYVHDFPGGAGRYIQKSSGYSCTMVNGEVFMEGPDHAGALAGRLLRSGDPTVTERGA